MNDDITTAVKVLGALAAAAMLTWLAVVMVKAAKRGGGMRGVGAMLLLSGWAHLRDPANNPVAEASEGRARKGTESGDPPPEDLR
ncbi:MAG TPA: hypothetical protein VFV88_01595 [Steroidobacteraceae bacterium]|jgi:hypothetical protein|nr:hypothetical protein [Steroidobacteraceae bacterium]